MGYLIWLAEEYLGMELHKEMHTPLFEYAVAPAALVTCVYGTYWITSSVVTSVIKTRRNDKKRAKKIAELKVIMDEWTTRARQTPKSEAEKILTMKFNDLRSALSNGKLSPVDVLRAYQYQAASMNKLYNFICEPIREAENIAERLESLSSEERQKLPFYGIPISVKENIFLEGYESTAGCTNLIGEKAERNSCLIQAFIDMGAVPFIRTNVTQTCLAFESTNPIYGTTCNPHNTERGTGGSSAGEGPCLATRSSVLGFGTDVGGSSRTPAAWCGCYSMKPTSGRWTHRGDASLDFNERTVRITIGSFAQEVDTLIECVRELSTSTSFNLDPYTPPIHFNDHELSSTRPLKIGYFKEFPILRSSAAAKRALNITLDILKQQGHEIVEWVPADMDVYLPNYWAKDLFGDGGEWYINKALANDKICRHLVETYYLSKLPLWLKKFLAFCLKPLTPEYYRRYLLAKAGCSSVAEWWKLEHDIREYRNSIIDELRNKEIDVIVSPAMPVPAVKLDTTRKAYGSCAFIRYMNLVNFPAGIVPITKYTADDYNIDMETYPTLDIWHNVLKTGLAGSEGLPMAVQIASLPFHEERCLRVMKEIENHSAYRL